MGLTRRVLPPEEYHRLAGTELERLAPSLSAGCRVLVVESDGELVGCWALVPVLHAEGVWIAPTHRRRVSLVRHLLEGMADLIEEAGATQVITAAVEPSVRGLLEGLHAEKVDADFYALSLKGWRTEETCLPQC